MNVKICTNTKKQNTLSESKNVWWVVVKEERRLKISTILSNQKEGFVQQRI